MRRARVSVVGGAVDFGRTCHARSQTAAALDAAILAATRVLQTEQNDAAAVAAAQI